MPSRSGPQWRFFSVSLLVVIASFTEGNRKDREPHCQAQEPSQGMAGVRVALIDFAHCFFGEPGPDLNFVRGLCALRQCLAQAKSELRQQSQG